MGLHTILLDAGPLLTNDPSISTLVAKSEKIFTTSAVLSELKDKDVRARVQATVLPFLTIRNPSPASIKLVSDFARRTGDLIVLSKADISIIALAYELECERNHGDWRLRRVPGQRSMNGKPPSSLKPETVANASDSFDVEAASEIPAKLHNNHEPPYPKTLETELIDVAEEAESEPVQGKLPDGPESTEKAEGGNAQLLLQEEVMGQSGDLVTETANLKVTDSTPDMIDTRKATITDAAAEPAKQIVESDSTSPILQEMSTPPPDLESSGSSRIVEAADGSSSDSDGWITPSNLKKHQMKDQNASATPVSEEKVMQVSTITSDFAMQNVLLQMNLNLLSPSLLRIKHLKTYILRCHACFQTTKQMDKQFCPRCGKPTLTRVSCSTNAQGEFKLHLKKNMQWNTRGDRYSIPKPVSGMSNGKFANGKGGGKGGWGQELILAEDQKEYVRAMQAEGRRKERNLMDEDYLPSILTGDRGKAGGRPRIGAGRNVNSRKRA